MIPKAEQKLETLNRQLAAAREEVEKPFPKEKELAGMLKRLAELNTMLNMDRKEEALVSNEEEKAAERAGEEEPAGIEKPENPGQPKETERDKPPEPVSREGHWTLQKIKEMQKRKAGGAEAARHSVKSKEINGIGRT